MIDNIKRTCGEDNSPPQPFRLHALEFHKLGLSVIPTKKKGKPLVAWKRYQTKQVSIANLYRWIDKYPNANIQIVTGEFSNITVVDCDNPETTIEELQSEFGETPFIVSTPRGGKHLYYKYNNEKTRIGYREKLDIKAHGGLANAPYSFNHDKNKGYSLFKGSLDDLKCLPYSKYDLPKNDTTNKFSDTLKEGDCTSDLNIAEGQRNNYLFNYLKNIAHSFRSYEKLEERALEINSFGFQEPLSVEEVQNTVKSVWGYKMKSTLFVNQRYSSTSEKEIKALSKHTKSHYLLSFLRLNHSGNKWFCISRIPVSKKLGWDEKTLKKAIDILLEKKFLFRRKTNNEKTRKGNKIKTEPYQYSLCKRE